MSLRQEEQEQEQRGGKLEQPAAAFRARRRKTIVMGLVLPSARTRNGHGRAREEKIRKTEDKTTTTAKSGRGKSYGSPCQTNSPRHCTPCMRGIELFLSPR